MQKFIDFPLLFFSNGLFLEPIKLFWKKVHKLARIKKKIPQKGKSLIIVT